MPKPKRLETPARRFRHRRAFWASWFSVRKVVSFRGTFEAESGGDSVTAMPILQKLRATGARDRISERKGVGENGNGARTVRH
jgi:hypothetical protein